jgi:hypothetical protein
MELHDSSGPQYEEEVFPRLDHSFETFETYWGSMDHSVSSSIAGILPLDD